MNSQSIREFLATNPPEVEVREFLKNASLNTVREFMRSVSANHSYYKCAEAELMAKLSEEERKIHWSTWVILVFTILGAAAALAAAIFAWKAL